VGGFFDSCCRGFREAPQKEAAQPVKGCSKPKAATLNHTRPYTSIRVDYVTHQKYSVSERMLFTGRVGVQANLLCTSFLWGLFEGDGAILQQLCQAVSKEKRQRRYGRTKGLNAFD